MSMTSLLDQIYLVKRLRAHLYMKGRYTYIQVFSPISILSISLYKLLINLYNPPIQEDKKISL